MKKMSIGTEDEENNKLEAPTIKYERIEFDFTNMLGEYKYGTEAIAEKFRRSSVGEGVYGQI